MDRLPQRLTTVVIVAVMLASVATIGWMGTDTVTAAHKRTAVSGAPPVIVYQGETLDVSNVGKTTGGTIGPGSVAFVGIAGAADGAVESESRATSVDFDNYATGLYDVDGDDRGEISVTEPRVSEVTLKLANGADVTNRRAPRGSTVTLTAKFNFEKADNVEITVRDQSGLGVTSEVVSSRTISTSGGSITLDFSNQETGTYTIIVEGQDLDRASSRVTLAVGTTDTLSIALDKTTVTKGEQVRATVTGRAGDTVHVRIRQSDLDGLSATDASAQQVFLASSDVTSRVGNSAQNVVVAVLKLNDNGIGRVAIRSEHLKADSTTRIFVAPGSNPATSSIDNIDLRISDRELLVRSAPTIVSVGERFTITGSAPRSNSVKAYARIGDTWRPLFRDPSSNRYAEATVRTDGSFELEISSSRVIHIPGSYPIGIAGDATKQYSSSQSLTQAQFRGLTSATTTLRTGSGQMTAQLSQSQLAAGVGDEVSVFGTAIGQGDAVHLYVVSPFGELVVADTVRIRDSTFSRSIDVFEERGTYRVIVASQGRDGQFKNGNTPPTVRQRIGSNRDQRQAVELIRDSYTGAGIDDVIVELSLTVSSPSLSINPVGANDQVSQQQVTVTGTSNRQLDTTIEVELVTADDQTVASVDTRVASGGTWQTTLDLSSVDPGTYTLRATDGDTTARRPIRVGTATTPTASVTFNDQRSDGTNVVVASVTVSHGGFVAIHSGSASGPVIGNSRYLTPGTHSNVRVTLNQPISAQTTLVAMPHQDTNLNRQYEFPDADGPYVADGRPVTDSATVSVRQAQPTPTPTPEPTPEPTPTSTPTPTSEPTPEPSTATPTQAPGGQPGFTAVVALVAVLVALVTLWFRRSAR